VTATRARQAWNNGLVGDPKPGRHVAGPGHACNVPRCGQTSTHGARAPKGMVRVIGQAGEPPRLYCKGWCTTYAQALADVRSLP
jgi:hypothetical protein